jgi:hypothetical protein
VTSSHLSEVDVRRDRDALERGTGVLDSFYQSGAFELVPVAAIDKIRFEPEERK